MPASSSSSKPEDWPGLLVRVTPAEDLKLATDGAAAASCHVFGPSLSRTLYREYEIRVAEEDTVIDDCDDDPICATRLRFSVFRERFVEWKLRKLLPPEADSVMPPRSWPWEDYTECPENVTKRATHIEVFLQTALNKGGVALLRSAFLWEALGVAPDKTRRLLNVAAGRARADKEARERRKARQLRVEKEEREARRRFRREDDASWREAQSLRYPETLSCPRKLSFVLREHFFKLGGNNTVTGANERPWFQLERTDYPQILPFADMTYEIFAIRDEVPLLELKERFSFPGMYVCDVRYLRHGRRPIPAVRVSLEAGIFHHTYTITGRGRLRDRRFSFRDPSIGIDGRKAGRLREHSAFLASGHYALEIFPNKDCLLLLGIACALVRIRTTQIAHANSAAAVI